MIRKNIILGDTFTQTGEPVLQPAVRWGDLVKTASLVTSDMQEFVNNVPRQKGRIYTLCIGVSNSAVWGPNANGEWFTPDSLIHDGSDYGFKTFMTLPAHFFRQHVNKDPAKSLGPVVYSTYNPHTYRVELIFRADRDRAEQLNSVNLYDRLEAGEPVPVSMGCRVPYDICSKCNQVDKNVTTYCEHKKPGKVLNIHPDGKQNCIINTKPKFFDISEVPFGADRTAWTLKLLKALNKGTEKTATINKRIEGVALPETMDPTQLAMLLLMSGQSLFDLLRTAQYLKVPFYPEEFLHLCRLSTKDAERLLKSKNLEEGRVHTSRELVNKLMGLKPEIRRIYAQQLIKKSGLGLPNQNSLVHTKEVLDPIRVAYKSHVKAAL